MVFKLAFNLKGTCCKKKTFLIPRWKNLLNFNSKGYSEKKLQNCVTERNKTMYKV